jgi:pSer/pThr/pTyr-binding forkhead associated (FHA) protein
VERDVTILVLRIGLVAVLYFFLFQLLLVLWRDLRPQNVTAPAPQPATGPALSIIDPASSGRAAAETMLLRTVNSLGRGPQNSIVLNDVSVSADHALVSYRLGQWWVEDVGSRNGTYLNDVRIDQPTVIHDGDVIRVGLVSLGLSV